MRIDINCDLGESFGNYRIGNDQAVFPYITSANIACGFHGGDPYHIEKTIELALKHNVQIGAHPGYPDLQGFGRRKMTIPLNELSSIIKYQVGALKSMVESHGSQLQYVKPHGALYNSMVNNRAEAEAVIQAIITMDPSLKIMGLAGSHVEEICQMNHAKYIAEAFADRRYTAAGQLVSRSLPNAVIKSPKDAASQVLSIVQNNHLKSVDGMEVYLNADSICIHGDNASAIPILESIHSLMKENQISIEAF